jgi:hypothetical protein
MERPRLMVIFEPSAGQRCVFSSVTGIRLCAVPVSSIPLMACNFQRKMAAFVDFGQTKQLPMGAA